MVVTISLLILVEKEWFVSVCFCGWRNFGGPLPTAKVHFSAEL